MGLGLTTGGGDANRTPIVKYDGRAGRLFRVDRKNENGSWVATATEITAADFRAIFDLENIEVGWLHFPSGGAPDIRTAKIGQPIGDKPSEFHRQGFRVLMRLGKSCGGDIREMAANAQVSIKGMDALYDAYVAGRAANPGKLPVVVLEKTTPVTTQGKDENGKPATSTNYQPVWKIESWTDRPADLSGSAPPAPAPAPAPPPPPPPQPAQQEQPALVAADGEEF